MAKTKASAAPKKVPQKVKGKVEKKARPSALKKPASSPPSKGSKEDVSRRVSVKSPPTYSYPDGSKPVSKSGAKVVSVPFRVDKKLFPCYPGAPFTTRGLAT